MAEGVPPPLASGGLTSTTSGNQSTNQAQCALTHYARLALTTNYELTQSTEASSHRKEV